MAYDAATGTTVLYGGSFGVDGRRGTWTWNGSTWTKQPAPTQPPALIGASMAYDAATGTIVLFGGYTEHPFGYRNGTWTWNGTTWTKQAPATSPPPMSGGAMAYDAATGTVVLFGGNEDGITLGDTWTWDGTTWTKQDPATSPPARYGASMAYDTATGTAVLFGGLPNAGVPNDTWTWNGTNWAKRDTRTRPHGRWEAAMAYDAASGTAVLFGGADFINGPTVRDDTWTWR